MYPEAKRDLRMEFARRKSREREGPRESRLGLIGRRAPESRVHRNRHNRRLNRIARDRARHSSITIRRATAKFTVDYWTVTYCTRVSSSMLRHAFRFASPARVTLRVTFALVHKKKKILQKTRKRRARMFYPRSFISDIFSKYQQDVAIDNRIAKL